MAVIQVTFDNTLWTSPGIIGTNPGDNGYNAGSVWRDKDGVTAWAFEWFGAGFARFNISDGSIVHQGAMFGTPGSTYTWYDREDGTSLWQQDNHGYYYVIPDNFPYYTLYKFKIGSGSAGSLLDGYDVSTTTFDLSTMTPSVNTFGAYEDMKVINISGTNYLAINTYSTTGKCLYVINADTLAFVGSYQPSTANDVGQVFGDGSGNIWASFNQATTHDAILVKWNPGLGVTGSTLNAVETVVSTAVLGHSNGVNFSTYAGSNNCILGSSGGLAFTDNDGDLTTVNLSSFTQVAVALQNGTNFFTGTFDAPLNGMDTGVQPSGSIGLIGSVANDQNNNAHQGGILNIFNATTLALTHTFDLTGEILTAGYLAGGTFHDFHTGQYPYCPITGFQYSETAAKVLVCYEFVGSAVYIVDVPIAPPIPTDYVEGYLLTSQVDAKSALANLMAAFFLDVVESDFVLKFIPRGINSSVLTIPENDLGLKDDKAKLVETQTMPQELPRFVDIVYVDPTIDWQQNKQHKHRSSRVIKSKQALTLSLPMVFDSTTARQIAEKALYLAWLERKPWSFNLFRPSYMVIDPADIIEFVYEGVTYTMRVVGNTIGVNYGLQIQGVSEDPNNYTSVTVAGVDTGITTQNPAPLFPTFLFLRDLPYLSDSDAIADRSLTGYYQGMSAADVRWVGGVLYRSSDDINFDSVDTSTSRMWYGQLNNTLGDPPALWTWDNTNTIDITMVDAMNFTLSGVNDVDVLNGANVLIIGNEVVQYVNAVQTSPGRYTLSRLLRGRRNTEQFAYGHSAHEIGFDPTTGLKRETSPLSLIGLERFYRGVTVGADIATVADTDFDIEANDLKPPFPVQITGTRSLGDLTIDWVRRTRYAGDWLNNTGNVPLNEDSEAYEIDILNGITVVRTITGLTSPTATYTAVQQITDFGSVQSAVSINVYQISGEVGRGFAGSATV